jgi:MFS family permease
MKPFLSFSSCQIGVAVLIGSIALLMLGLQPILLGELVDRHLITMEGVGIVAMGEIVALGLGVVLGDVLVTLSRYRLIAVLVVLVAVAVDLATCFASGDAEFAVLRALAGLAEGMLVGIATNIVVRSNDPDRLAAVLMVVATVAQIGVSALLPVYVIPQGGWMGGWQGGFRLLAISTLFALILMSGLPPRLAPLESSSEQKFHWSVADVLSLLIAFLQMAAMGALWAYLEPLGLHVGLDTQGSQAMASEVLIMQVIGGIAAIWLVHRLRIVMTISVGSLVMVGIACGIHFLPAGATMQFALLCAVFGFFWLLLMPFHISLALRADEKGRVAILVPAAQLLGLAFGPLIASFLVSGDEAGPVPLVSLCFAVVSLALLLLGRKHWKKAAPVPTEIYTGKPVLGVGAPSGLVGAKASGGDDGLA